MPIPLSKIPVEAIDAWLPQTQCTRCGYPRCLDYARAIADHQVGINRCPPGGDATLRALSELLKQPPLSLAPECGSTTPRVRAVVDEDRCIGCTKCLPVCPVDAIVGGPKRMHTVIAALCTGCELCLAPCPVDCIALVATTGVDDPWPGYSRAEAERFRTAATRHFSRLMHRSRRRRSTEQGTPAHNRERIRHEIAAAVARVRQRRSRPA